MAIQFDHTANGLVTITTTDAASPSPYTLRLPNGAGSSGQFLTTDGTGNLSFTTAATSYDSLTTKPSLNVTFTGDVTGAGNVNLSATNTNLLSIALDLSETGVAAATYGNANVVAQITVDAEGRVTSAQNVQINKVFTVLGGNTISSCTMTSHPNLNTSCFNFFAGQNAGKCNTTGAFNFFAGKCAGSCNTTGSNNIFIGLNAGQCNTTGEGNNFFGSLGGYNTTTGSNNNFLGFAAGGQNTTGSYNTFIGYQAGFNNISGNRNNFLGIQAGFSNTTGCDNNFIGRITGYRNTTGCNNNFIGFGAGACNTTGSKNIYLGCDAGCIITTGNNNIVLGSVSSGLAAATSNVILFATGNTQRYCYSAATGNTTILGNIISNGGVFFGSGAGITSINYCNVTVNRPAANILLTGDVTGSANAILTPGSTILSIAATIAPNSVALGTDTTGNYVAGVTAGTGILVTGSAGEGWSPTVSANTTYLDGRYLVLDNASLQTVTGPVAFNGNVFFEGAVTYVGAQNLTVEDSIITLADNNTADVVDIGIVGRYDTTKYTGFFRDASDGVWRLFKDYTAYSNTNTTIDITNASYAYADLVVQKLTANSTVDSTSTSTGSIITLGGMGVAGNLFVGKLIVSGSGHTIGGNVDSCSAIIGGSNNSMQGKGSAILASQCVCIHDDATTTAFSDTSIIAASRNTQIRGGNSSAIIGSTGSDITASSKYSVILGSCGLLAGILGSENSGIINSWHGLSGVLNSKYSTVIASCQGAITTGANTSIIAASTCSDIQQSSCNTAIIGGDCGNISGGLNSVIIGGFCNKILANSGNSLILGGQLNTISGSESTLILGSTGNNSYTGGAEYSSVISSYNGTLDTGICYSTVLASTDSYIQTGGAFSAVIASDTSIVSGVNSAILGAVSGTNAGNKSVILGGCNNTITDLKNSSAILAGIDSCVNSNVSVILGGYNGLSDSDGKIVIPGHYTLTAPWTNKGSAQIGIKTLLGNTTSTASKTDLKSSPTASEFNRSIGIRNSHVYTVKGTVTAANTTGTTKVWEYTTVAKANGTGVISFVGSYGNGNAIINIIAADSGTSTWDVRFISGRNATSQTGWITANVTGSADTIRWLLSSETSEMKFN